MTDSVKKEVKRLETLIDLLTSYDLVLIKKGNKYFNKHFKDVVSTGCITVILKMHKVLQEYLNKYLSAETDKDNLYYSDAYIKAKENREEEIFKLARRISVIRKFTKEKKENIYSCTL